MDNNPQFPQEETTPSSSDRMEEDGELPHSAENLGAGGADSSSSDDSGHSDSESEDEAELNLQIETLESEVAANPYNYDAYVQYIKLLRKTADLEKLRQARETMSAIFPLSPSMWQDWTKDEASLSSSADAVPEIEKLYERGLSDYQSVSLWCDYLNFLQESDPSVTGCSLDGISKMRNLFERAIPAVGFHVTEGHKIWEAYRDFEQAIFLTIDETSITEKEKQMQRIRSIFQRQLSVPLANLSSTLSAYKAWEVEQGVDLDVESDDLSKISPQVAAAYKKASNMYNDRTHLEEQVSRKDLSEADKFQQYLNYIKFEQTCGDPARVQAIYERAVTEFPISSDLWIDYTRYLDKTLKVGKVIKDVYSRATRSCSWTGELWARYLLALERGSSSEKDISAVFERSLQCTFSSFEEYLDLYLTRVDGLRRRMSSSSGLEALDFSLIKETCQQASDYLTQHMQNTDGLLRLHVYWSNLELNLGKDLAGARGVWESFLKRSGSMLAAWQGYIDMEVRLGHIKEARSIYRRCYTRKFDGTGSEDICHGWLHFEREHGTLDDCDHAVQKVAPRLEELRLLKLQQESKSLKPPENLKKHKPQKSVREKRKAGPNVDEQSPAKRPKNKGQKMKETEFEAQNVAELNRDKMKARSETAADSNKEDLKSAKPVKPKVYTDECTAFISNLNLKAHEEDIRRFFSDVGGVVSVRILHHKDTKKSRGLAYVDFADDEHLNAAIAKNRNMHMGKKVSIARSNPKKGRKEFTGRSGPPEHGSGSGNSKDMSETSEKSKAFPTGGAVDKQGDNIPLRGKNTFAVPRNVKPLGFMTVKSNADETEEDMKPKSNDEFRNMFLKK
ncbi:PREDICTED: squamous cell carcinoma antigen recognized by T-cells 3 [Tarenaya hassleriana]|uniref:squamous cell carcinoma antigen recognized by T-cells 3 n=1 Tax=Tarenaya hassleriana TaxID=28532 RepID=UPI00053C7583|nr:PREDICTED: squamous cell carcinoma antigen recognized by T-cells 3 [Tarenaya hassleriana]